MYNLVTYQMVTFKMVTFKIVEDLIETNDRENDPHEAESEPVTYAAKVIRIRLKLGGQLGNIFSQNDANIKQVFRFRKI